MTTSDEGPYDQGGDGLSSGDTKMLAASLDKQTAALEGLQDEIRSEAKGRRLSQRLTWITLAVLTLVGAASIVQIVTAREADQQRRCEVRAENFQAVTDGTTRGFVRGLDAITERVDVDEAMRIELRELTEAEVRDELEKALPPPDCS